MNPEGGQRGPHSIRFPGVVEKGLLSPRCEAGVPGITVQVQPDTNAMPLGQRSELRKLEEDPGPGPGQGLEEAQQCGAGGVEALPPSSASASSQSTVPSLSCSALSLGPPEEGSAAGTPSPPQSPQRACPSPAAMAATVWSLPDQGSSSSDEEGSSTWEESEEAEPRLSDVLQEKTADLVGFLLLKYLTKEPTSQAEMLAIVGEDEQDAFPGILGQASKCMQLVFGVEVKEVDPSEHSYVLVPVLGLTCDAMLSIEQGAPKTGLLVVLLGAILLEGDRALEEVVWEALGVMGVYAGEEHIIYGEPRELLTNVWVQEGYLEYRQVPGSDPARYEFLWGPRAHAETSRLQVLEYLLRVYPGLPVPSLAPSEEAVSHEEEGA
ncbi:melanoma-associated antigen 8-like isoform X1 [Lutra lutra]|uniref:melanoma-associated antigen 8-like isoform X1 n=2 Tax=Lutra lutra TaxID=9657 RepID=UPI001FD2CEA8|nr:melanoma-associated antigen 8-like isoform X1 [Lutra lutra]